MIWAVCRTTEKYCLLTLQSGFHEDHANASKSLCPCKSVVRTFWNGVFSGFVLLSFLGNTKLSDEDIAQHVLVPCSSDCPVCEPNFFSMKQPRWCWVGTIPGWGQVKAEAKTWLLRSIPEFAGLATVSVFTGLKCH